MTVIGLLLLFWIAKRAYMACLKHPGPVLRYLFIFFGLVTLHEHTIVWALRLIGVRVFSENFLPDKERSLVVLAAINLLLLAVIIIAIYFSNIKWRWKIPVIFILYIAFFAAAKFHLIIYKEGWFLISSSICIWGMYFYTYILDKLYGNNEHCYKNYS